MSVSENVAPKLCADMQSACLAGDYEQALILHDKLLPLHQVRSNELNPSCIKHAVSLTGLRNEEVRPPMVPVSQQTKDGIRNIIEKLGVFKSPV